MAVVRTKRLGGDIFQPARFLGSPTPPVPSPNEGTGYVFYTVPAGYRTVVRHGDFTAFVQVGGDPLVHYASLQVSLAGGGAYLINLASFTYGNYQAYRGQAVLEAGDQLWIVSDVGTLYWQCSGAEFPLL